MRVFFEEYGAVLIAIVTGLFIFILLITTAIRTDLIDSIFVSNKANNDTMVGVQTVVVDDELYNRKLSPTLEVYDIVLNYGEELSVDKVFSDECGMSKCAKAYVQMPDGKVQDLRHYVTFKEVVDGETIDSIDITISGIHAVDVILNWNSIYLSAKINVIVLDDPNILDFDNPDMKNNFVRGSLKDPNGDGISTQLQLKVANGEGNALIFTTKSGDSGSFIIYGLKAGLSYELYVVGYEDTPISTFMYEGGEYNMGVIVTF